MVPPTGIVFIFLLGTLTLVLGMALGWAWGVVAMKAAMAARPAAETQAKLQALGQAAYSQANSTGQPVAAVQQQLVYTGWMLDARVTAVYYCLICLFIYLIVRVLSPSVIIVTLTLLYSPVFGRRTPNSFCCRFSQSSSSTLL
jgi:hypothetical protein